MEGDGDALGVVASDEGVMTVAPSAVPARVTPVLAAAASPPAAAAPVTAEAPARVSTRASADSAPPKEISPSPTTKAGE